MGDLILLEASELHGFILFVVKTVCKQFDHDNVFKTLEFDVVCSDTFQEGIWEMDSKDWGRLFWIRTDFILEAMMFFVILES